VAEEIGRAEPIVNDDVPAVFAAEARQEPTARAKPNKNSCEQLGMLVSRHVGKGVEGGHNIEVSRRKSDRHHVGA
jgi:hypothetical protein